MQHVIYPKTQKRKKRKVNFIEICLTKGLQKEIQNLILTSKKFRQLKASKYNNCRYAYRNMTQDQNVSRSCCCTSQTHNALPAV